MTFCSDQALRGGGYRAAGQERLPHHLHHSPQGGQGLPQEGGRHQGLVRGHQGQHEGESGQEEQQNVRHIRGQEAEHGLLGDGQLAGPEEDGKVRAV